MRCLTLFLCLPLLVAAQDAQEIVRRALAEDSASTAASTNYTYMEQLEVRTLEGGGKYKVRQKELHDVTLLEGSPYRRLVSQNDKPLSAKDQAKEEERLRRSIEDRRHETEEQKKQRIAEWHRKEEKQHEPLHEIPDGFFLRLAPDESIDGQAVWVIDATPKPGYKPKTKSAFFLPKVKIRLWIAKEGYHPVKAEFETLDTISWGGVVARVSKGAHLLIEQTRVNNEVWLPKRILLTGSARIMLVKGFTGEVDLTYSGYKKFSAESRVVTFEN
jgi:hypothetical protein